MGGQYKWVVTPGNEFPAVACVLMAVGGEMSKECHAYTHYTQLAMTCKSQNVKEGKHLT